MRTNASAIELDMRICCELKRPDYEMKAKRPVMTSLPWSLRFQVNRFMRSITSLQAFKGSARSWAMTVTACIARLCNIRRLASR